MPGIIKSVVHDEPAVNAGKLKEKKSKRVKEPCTSDDEAGQEQIVDDSCEKAEKKKNRESKNAKKVEVDESENEEEAPKPKSKKRKEQEDTLESSPEHKKKKSQVEDAPAKQLSPFEYRKVHDIRVLGSSPDPFQTFEAAGFNKELLQAVKTAGFTSPSGIQSQCWPLAMAGSNLIAIAKTGSGKTAGYLFPAFMLVRKSFPLTCKRGDGPVAVVLAPTRELAIQIEQEAVKFGKSSGIVTACIYGGVPKGPQIRAAMFGLHVLIATPGRMNDFLKLSNPPVIPLNRVRYLVLDEADRMLDMGFEPQIKSIFDQCPKEEGAYQTIMFTATWPKEVKSLAARYLKDYVQVNIGESGEQLTANKDVEQVIYRVRKHDKDDKLIEVLKSIPDASTASVIVFANQKSRCDYIVEGLKGVNWPAVSIHGDKDQWERQRALDRFTKGQVRVIVATDVAARGLDIKGVSHVINYDFPINGTEDWIHRVGRTGRAGAKGTAVTLFDEGCDKRSAKELCTVLSSAAQPVPDWLRQLGSHSNRGGPPARRPWGQGGRGGRGGGGRGGGRRGGGGGWRGGGGGGYNKR